jgi:hypothetical protein
VQHVKHAVHAKVGQRLPRGHVVHHRAAGAGRRTAARLGRTPAAAAALCAPLPLLRLRLLRLLLRLLLLLLLLLRGRTRLAAAHLAAEQLGALRGPTAACRRRAGGPVAVRRRVLLAVGAHRVVRAPAIGAAPVLRRGRVLRKGAAVWRRAVGCCGRAETSAHADADAGSVARARAPCERKT